MNKEIVRGQDLWQIYKLGEVEVEALRGVNLSLQEGDFVALVGSSGSGKSTLLHLLGCLDRPTRGRVFFEGQDVSRLGDGALTRIRARGIGFIFQTFNLMPVLNAIENVEVQLRLAGMGKERRLAQEALEKMGLGHRAKHLPRQLSGGERQRLAIARAIVKRPRLLLADEPTGNLDTARGKEIQEILTRLNGEGLTIIVVTHNLELAHAARRVLTLRDGRIGEEG